MIELRNITVSAGKFTLQDVSLLVPQGKYAVFMGRTGCGKTTILETICGLRRPASGQVFIGNREVTRLLPGDRQLGYLPQDLALFPTLTVRQHLEFALRIRKVAQLAIEQRTAELAGQLGIEHLLDRKPTGLSGGEAQRVALGRALAFRPTALLLDEPLSALDSQTRSQMQDLLNSLKATGITTLHITHNEGEAEALADLSFHLNSSGIQPG